MNRVRLPFLLLCATLSASLAAAQPKPDRPETRTLSVNGEGRVDAAPDLAIVSFAVEVTASEASAAVEQNAERSAAVAAAVKKLLTEKDRTTTTGYSLDPIYDQREAGTSAAPRIGGYIARNEVQVRVHAIAAVGTLIDAAIRAGSNRVSGLQFTLEDQSPQMRQALLEAGTDARRQAEAAAQALGVKLGPVVSARTGGGPIVLPEQRFAMAEAKMATPIEPGAVSVRATLQVTYEIE
jgi:uncharacterized protein